MVSRVKESWFDEHPVISIIAGLLGLLIIGVVLDGFLNDEPTYSVYIPTNDSTVSITKNEITQPVQKKGWAVTVNSAIKQEVIGDCGELGWSCDTAKSGKIFLIADVTVENNGAEVLSIGDLIIGNYISQADFTIKDDNYYVYPAAFVSYLDQEFPTGQIQEREIIRGKIAFEIPRNTTGLKLIFKDLTLPIVVVSQKTETEKVVKSGTISIDNVQVQLANLYPVRVTVTNTGNTLLKPKFDVAVYKSGGEKVCSGSPLFTELSSLTAGAEKTGELTIMGCIFTKDGTYTLIIDLLDDGYNKLDSDSEEFIVNYWGQFGVY